MRTDLLRAATMAMMMFALVLRRAERRVAERLRGAGAAARDAAVGLAELGWRERLMLRRLVWGRAVVPVGDEKYYLDPAGYPAFRRRRRVRAAVVLGGVLVLAGLMWWRG